MYRTTTDLIHRVEALVDEHREFFGAVREWYADAQLAGEAVRLLTARSSAGARVSLAVNGQQLMVAATVAARSQGLRWTLDPALLEAGDNEVAVCVEPRAGRRLYVRSVAVSQDGTLPEQVLALDRREPARTPHLALSGAHDARFDGDVWAVRPGGGITLRLQLSTGTPVNFALSLLNETVDARAVFDLLQKVTEKVRAVREKIDAARRIATVTDPTRASRLSGDVDDLDAYLQLHVLQVEPAFRGGNSATLRDVIARTGDPDHIVESFRTAEPANPAVRVVRITSNAAAPPVPPPVPRTPPVPPAAPATAVAAGSSVAWSWPAVVVGAALVLGGVGYGTWSMLRPAPAVQFTSLVDGQSVAPDSALQVWVSALDESGIESLAVTAEASGGATVAGTTPERLTFPAGTRDTGSRVFTVNVGPLRGPSGTVTLVATTVNGKGQTGTARRTLAVGGAASDLQWEIVPAEPKPGQPVSVVVRMVNPRPGATISYSLTGTDGYPQRGDLPVGPDGTVRFGVPGAREGVEDVIEGWIPGTDVRRKVSYKF